MTSEQLEAARAERMRHNGQATLTLEEARIWIEETGLCLFLPRKQFTSSVAPSFVEAVAGNKNVTAEPRQIALSEELLVRLELGGVAVRLNLQGQLGEQPDFVVASWVLPYVYALRGDRDWRRVPQLTGSRAVSPLAIQAYKLLEANDSTVAQLKHALGREVTEVGVARAITELWQQLRIIPVIAAPGQPAKWQLLRHRFQKAIAEGASTSQVTAISVLASIYLQAVIAASMEDVEFFLAPLTARSKIREVLRGLVATRQVHTLALGHAPHFYVAGTLPEFPPATSIFTGTQIGSTSFGAFDHEEPRVRPVISYAPPVPAPAVSLQPPQPAPAPPASVTPPPSTRQPAPAVSKPSAPHPHFSRPAAHNRNRKPVAASRSGKPSAGSRIARRSPETRPSASRSSNGARPSGKSHATNLRSKSSTTHSGSNGNNSRHAKPAAPSWTKRNGHAPTAKPGAKSAAIKRNAGLSLKDPRTDARAARNGHKPALTAGAKAGNTKRFGFTARADKGTKKRG